MLRRTKTFSYTLVSSQTSITFLFWKLLLQEFFRLAIDAMAKNSLRCVAIACRTQELNKVPKEQEDLDKWSLPEDELTLLAIVGIKVGMLKS